MSGNELSAPARQCQAARRVRRRLSDLRGEQDAAARALFAARAIRSPAQTSSEKLRLLKTHELSRLPDQDLRLQRGGGQLLPGPHPAASSGSAAMRCRPPTRATTAIPASAASTCRRRRCAARGEPYIYHFPDGNASLARLLVRALIPGVAPGNTMDDVVLAPFDYARLDAATARCPHPSRLDLHRRAQRRRRACWSAMCATASCIASTARHAVLACFHMMIPHLMPELAGGAARRAGAERQDADRLHQRAGAQLAAMGRAEGQRHLRADVVPQPRRARFSGQPRRLSASARSGRADVPAPRACRGRAQPGAHRASAVQDRAGEAARRCRSRNSRHGFATSSTACSAPGGFSSGRDIAAITVNRWPHGYGYVENSLFDGDDYENDAGARAADGRPRRDRQFRRRRRRLCPSGDRSGGARGARTDRLTTCSIDA